MEPPLNANAPCQKVRRAEGIKKKKISHLYFEYAAYFSKNIVRRVLLVCHGLPVFTYGNFKSPFMGSSIVNY